MAWMNKPPLPTGVAGLAAVTADAPSPAAGYRIYALGGNQGMYPVILVQAYDTTTATWSQAPPMSVGRAGLAAASGGGRIYALGGANPGGGVANNEIFNPAGNNWTEGAPLPTARASLGAAAGPDGLIYAIGGFDTGHLDATEAYDPVADAWTSLPGMPTARNCLAVVTGPDGLIYAIGGLGGSGVLATVEVFDTSAGTWSAAPPMPSACWNLAAAVGPDGLIYAFGGQDPSGTPLNSVFAYDTVARTWSVQPSMLTPQAFLAGTTGPDGLIYALGGGNPTQPDSVLNTVEAFTTATPLTAPDPYIGNGTYQSPDIVLLDSSNNPVPIGGAPGGAWDTLLIPNTSYGLQAVVYNDSAVPAVGTVVGFWHFPGGVGTSGAQIDQQTVTVPANGSVAVSSASPFQSGPPLAHECVAVSIACPGSPYFTVSPTTATQVIDPAVAQPADSGHFGSAWRNTNSLLLRPGAGWVFPFRVGRLPEPLTVHLAAKAAKVPAAWDARENVAAFRRALEFVGAATRVPLFLIPELRAELPEADLELHLYTEADPVRRGSPTGAARHTLTVRASESGGFYLSGRMPSDAQKGDVFLVKVEARYPATESRAERVVDYLEIIHVK